jgi:uncharacterized membrane protein
MIVVLLGFIGYELYRIVLGHSVALIALTVFDIAMVVLTWREYGRHRQTKEPSKEHPSKPSPPSPQTLHT